MPLEGVRAVELNNPRRRNALSMELLRALDAALAAAEADAATRVVVIRSSTPGMFCSGHDLAEVNGLDGNGLRRLFDACAGVMVRIEASDKPIVAEVDGVATAAGCQLVASCDLAVCSGRSAFATPGVNLGLFCSTPAVPLVRHLASRKHAMELLLTGEFAGAERAREMGLVNFVVDDEEGEEEREGGRGRLGEAVDDLAARIASRSTEAIRIGKAGLRRWGGGSGSGMEELRRAYAIASRTMVENMHAPDAAEGIGAFLEKRAPLWGRGRREEGEGEGGFK